MLFILLMVDGNFENLYFDINVSVVKKFVFGLLFLEFEIMDILNLYIWGKFSSCGT